MLHPRLTRSVSLLAAFALVHSAGGAGLVAAAPRLSETTGRLLTPLLPTYTPGRLVDKSGPSGSKNYEGIGNGGIPSGAILIKDDDRAGEWWYNAGNNIGGEIEARKIGCWALTTNSNAFLYAVLQRAGLLDEWYSVAGGSTITDTATKGDVWAPG